uniref:Uncharacterized protein n=1 Tax=Candidatus Kentrum sp. MB TaxID=2138164 RepID=A0A451B8J5_9GAMM|nr:MAG: hypothetical protein BECKMB1821I_GA0114274_10012 [Candidatus Kentron sp. MB]VFK74581.1 MAG: hypothetical protein BECKMB1821H_GA0114242_100672 [Candidatus Kentron sp. MB]
MNKHPFPSLFPAPSPPRRQRGAALILLLSVVVFLTLFSLFSGCPRRMPSLSLRQAEKTMAALGQGKQALLGWAVSHPHAPGLMPWPDRNGDGNYDGDSDCASLPSHATFNPGFLLGRLPWRARTSPCERAHGGLGIDARDSSGARLWYGISRNLIRRYQSPARYPAINPELATSAPFPWFTVRDGAGALISDRVAAVILAPGVALGNQNRVATAPDPEQYLDTHAGTGINNADSDGCRDNNPGCGGVDGEEFVLAKGENAFNDRLLFITIDELIAKVERRVLNELTRALNRHRATSGVYPWPAPFAYPPAMASGVVTETAADAARTLIDTKANFTAIGVQAGQIIRNLTDGSKAIIDAIVSSERLSLAGDGLRHGNDNRFDVNLISRPDDNDRYEILTDTSGVATSATLGNTLQDTDRGMDFGALGIRIGDMVENVTDGTYGVVTNIPDADTLALRRLASDKTMGFDPGDSYEIPRFNGVPGTREGALPIHAVGERFQTGFTVGWNIPAVAIATTPSVNNGAYLAALEKALRCSDPRRLVMSGGGGCDTGYSPRATPWSEGSCAWQRMETVRCQGRTDWDWYLAGTVTANHGDPWKLTDTGMDFAGRGVDAGDVIRNDTDGSHGVIESVSGGELKVAWLHGGSRNNFAIGDKYRVRVATNILPERSASCANIPNGGEIVSCDSRTLVDVSADFWGSGVRPGDTIENRTRGWWGIIETVGQSGAFPQAESTLRVEPMGAGAPVSDFADGDSYIIRTAFVDKRRYGFQLAFTGNVTIPNDNTGLRHVGTGANATLPAQNQISSQDWDAINQRTVLRAAINTNPATPTTGEIRVSGMQHDLAPDLPAWFFTNQWYKFIYMAVSPSHLPGGNGNCVSSNDCLILKTIGPGGTTIRNDIQALLLSAGPPTRASGCLQNRPAADPGQYFEKENVHPGGSGNIFARPRWPLSDKCFLDRIRIVAP